MRRDCDKPDSRIICGEKRTPGTKRSYVYIISIINISNYRLKPATITPPVSVKILTEKNLLLKVITKVIIDFATNLMIVSYWLSMRVRRMLNFQKKKIIKTK